MKKSAVILLVCLTGLTASAEIIKDIRILNQEGESYDISSVSAFTSFEIGEQVPDQGTILSAIAVDVDRMRESGRYSYVDAHMDLEEDGVVLVYTVVSKYRLRRIEIRGAGAMTNRRVRKKSELEVGTFADDATFKLAATRIEAAYRDDWYPDAEVEWTAKRNTELGTVDVTFRIDEGEKMAVKRIVFEGNEVLTNDELRSVMQQKQKSWFPLWSWITGAGKYDEQVVDADVFSIKSLYMNHGFLDVQVSDPQLDDSKPGAAALAFRIDEGQRYRIGEINLSGMEAFSEEELQRVIRLQPGSSASYESISAVSEAIRSYYGNRGYVRTSVRPVFDADAENGIVNIRYEIGEGRVGYLSKVNISGNERTQDKVIRRELVAFPGEKYNRSRVTTSEARLRNLNYFEYVSISPEQTAETDQYNLNVLVKEKPTGQFTAGVGFSSVDSLVGYVELSQGNFNYRRWPPVGAGQKFKIRAQLGTRRNDLDVSFVEPWFLNRQLSAGIDLYHREARYFSDDYDQQTDGMRLSLGKALSRFTRGRLAYSLEQFNVFDVSANASLAIQNEEGRRIKSGMEYTWTFDTRDRFFNPTRGNKTTVSPYMAGGLLGGETDIFGARVRSTQHLPLIWDMVFNLRGQVESVESFGDSKDEASQVSPSFGYGVPIFDRLFLGGSYTLRGYEFRDVGPKDPLTENSIGGNSSAFATAELNYPIWNQIRGAVFYDWGFVNVDSWDFDPAFYSDNWGIGLRFDLPGFPLHLDYAWPITYDEDFHDGQGRFNFLIGHTF